MVLWVFFILATLLLLVHFLNMLIAIMSETLAKNNERGTEVKFREHLRFIVENWYIIPDRKPYYQRLDKRIYENEDPVYEDTFTALARHRSLGGVFLMNVRKCCCGRAEQKKSKGVNYLVTAFLHEEDEEQVEILKELQDDVNTMRATSSQDLDDILQQVKNIRTHVREHHAQLQGQ